MSIFCLRMDSATGDTPEPRTMDLDLIGVRNFLESEEPGPAAYLFVNEDLDELIKSLPKTLPFTDLNTQTRNERSNQTTPFRQTFAHVHTVSAAVRSNYTRTRRLLSGVAKLFEGWGFTETRIYFIGVPKHQWEPMLRGLKPESSDLLALRRRFVGKSADADEVRRRIQVYAPYKGPVLITGASGTGKEVVAQLLHDFSGRTGKCHALNCAAVVESLSEDELFGRVRGAFTGATVSRVGAFLLAQNGTLFFDEIGDLSMPLQAKLLRVLQEGEVMRLGDDSYIKFNVRVVAATNKDLAEMVKRGEFRADLYYRLRGFQIFTPPPRSEDLRVQVRRVWCGLKKGLGMPAEVMRTLCSRRWPGNVRELEAFLEVLEAESGSEDPTPELVERLLWEQENHRPAPDSTEREPRKRLGKITNEFKELRDEYVAAGQAVEGFLRERAAVLSPGVQIETRTRTPGELANYLQTERTGSVLAEIPDLCRVRVVVETTEAVRDLASEIECILETQGGGNSLVRAATPEGSPEGSSDADAVEHEGALRELEFGPTRCRVRVGETPLFTLGSDFNLLSEEARDVWVDVDIRTLFVDQWEAVRDDRHVSTEDQQRFRGELLALQVHADRIGAARRAAAAREIPARPGEMWRELKRVRLSLEFVPEDEDLSSRAAMLSGLLGDMDGVMSHLKSFSDDLRATVLREIGVKMCARYARSSDGYRQGLELQKIAANLELPDDEEDPSDDGRSYYCMMSATDESDVPMLDDPASELRRLYVPRRDHHDA